MKKKDIDFLYKVRGKLEIIFINFLKMTTFWTIQNGIED